MSRFTKAQRQQIIRDFAEQNGGVFDAAAFLGEVQQVGKEHPAHAWFQWDDDKAAREHRLWQAREFAQGLVVRFEVQTIERGKVKVVTATAPLVVSPIHQRKAGGGYLVTEANNPAHLQELCKQGAQSMRSFILRYEAAAAFAGVDAADLQRILDAFEAASLAAAA